MASVSIAACREILFCENYFTQQPTIQTTDLPEKKQMEWKGGKRKPKGKKRNEENILVACHLFE